MHRSRLPAFIFLLSAAVVGSWLVSCGGDDPQAPPGDGAEVNGIDSIPPAAVVGLADFGAL